MGLIAILSLTLPRVVVNTGYLKPGTTESDPWWLPPLTTPVTKAHPKQRETSPLFHRGGDIHLSLCHTITKRGPKAQVIPYNSLHKQIPSPGSGESAPFATRTTRVSAHPPAWDPALTGVPRQESNAAQPGSPGTHRDARLLRMDDTVILVPTSGPSQLRLRGSSHPREGAPQRGRGT